MRRVVQFLGGLLWAVSRPLRRRGTGRLPAALPDAGPPPWAGPRRRGLRRWRTRAGWHPYEPVWAAPAPRVDDDGPGRSRPLRRGIWLGAGSVVLLVTLIWLIAGVVVAITATPTTATVTAATSDGCTVSYTAPDGRHRTGDVDCRHPTVGSSRTVWVLSDDPGDVAEPGVVLAVGLGVTVAGALFGAALVRIGRGRRQAAGRHEARALPVALRVRWWLSRRSGRPRS